MVLEILVSSIVGGLITYLIIQYLRKRRILKGLRCPYCREDLVHEYNNNMNFCNRCKRKIKFPKM